MPSTAEVPANTGPKRLGKYELQRVLGSGGMGTVHLALDTDLKRTVALKVLPAEKAKNETLVRRFKSEAQAAAQLRHRNVVSVYEAGTADGLLYIAMEYIDGRDVHEMIVAKGKMDPKQATGIIKQAAIALQHAYEIGIVHRDIKPSNLMVDRAGVVKLADMGLARNVDDDEAGITRDGTTVGTVDYMSPEQATNSHRADIRSDLYSLGCSWYHMLTGRPPFEGSMLNKLKAHAMGPRPDPRDANPDISEGMVTILHRMMERSPKSRYQTPAELVAAIDGLRATSIPDEEQDEFAAQLAAIVEETPELDERSRRPPSTRSGSGTRSGRRGRPRSGAGSATRSRPSRRRKRRKTSAATGPIIAAVVIGVTVLGGGLWWAMSGPGGDPNEVTKVDPDPDDPGPVAPGPVDPGPVDPGPVDPGPVDPGPVDPGPVDPGPQVSPRITIGSPVERPLLPEWIAEVLLPEEAARPPASWGLEVVGVGGPDDADSKYRDLAPAILSAPASGRAIRLNGPGPFVLDPVELDGRGHVVISGDPRQRSLVVIDNDAAGGLAATVAFTKTSLTLVDVDVLVDGPPPVGSVPDAISVTDGDLVLRRCSVTYRDDPTRPGSANDDVRLLHVAGRAQGGTRSARVLFDRVHARGEHVRVLQAENVDVATWNSVLATGTGPAICLGSDAAAISPRHVDLFSTTLYAAREGVRMEVSGESTPPETNVRVHESIVATRENDGTLLRCEGWPIVGAPGVARFELPGLSWRTTDSTYPGWDHTVQAVNAEDDRVLDGDRGWQQVLEPAIGRQCFPLRWPVNRVSAFSDVVPGTFDPSTGTAAKTKATDGSPVGADVNLLTVPTLDLVRRGRVLAERPGLPQYLVPKSPEPIAFTMSTTRDLGRFLSSDEVPDGSHVVVTGSGAVPSSPIFLDGKSVRLEFRQPAEGRFVVAVRGATVDAEERRRGRQPAFITLRKGTLEVEGGLFLMTGAAVGTPAEWFLHATDAEFAFRRCVLRGPVVETTSLREMIRWEASRDSNHAGRAIIADSYVVATRPLLTGHLRHRSVVVRNSVLAGADALFEFDVTGFDPNIDAAVDVRDSTLCAGRTVFSVEGRELPGGVRGPMRVHVDQTVFGEPVGLDLESRTHGPVLFAVSEPMIRQSQISWFGHDNAYVETFHAYLVDEAAASPPTQSFDTDWRALWRERERRPLVGPVTFVGGSPADAASYRLSDDTPAATWRLDGGSIGAPVQAPPVDDGSS